MSHNGFLLSLSIFPGVNLSISSSVYLCTHLCIYLPSCLCVHVYIYACMCVCFCVYSVYIYIFMYTLCAHIQIQIHLHLHVCMCMYVHVWRFTYINIYLCNFNSSNSATEPSGEDLASALRLSLRPVMVPCQATQLMVGFCPYGTREHGPNSLQGECMGICVYIFIHISYRDIYTYIHTQGLH